MLDHNIIGDNICKILKVEWQCIKFKNWITKCIIFIIFLKFAKNVKDGVTKKFNQAYFFIFWSINGSTFALQSLMNVQYV